MTAAMSMSTNPTAGSVLGQLHASHKQASTRTPQVSQLACFANSNAIFRAAAMRSPGPQSPPPSLGQAVCADLAQEMKRMQAAEKRWETQVKEGKVKSLSPKEAGYAVQLNKYTFLDVRPSTEHNKVSVKDSVWIPMYEVNNHIDPGTLMKKASNLAMGGWWSGQTLMKYNERFMPDVVAKVPKSANVIVGCQKGLRSLAACEQMYRVGYRNLFWLNGGLDAAQEGDFEREGTQPFKFAGIGGVSEFLGWTDVQRAEATKQGLGYRVMLFARLIGLVLAVDLFFLGSQQLSQFFSHLQH